MQLGNPQTSETGTESNGSKMRNLVIRDNIYLVHVKRVHGFRGPLHLFLFSFSQLRVFVCPIYNDSNLLNYRIK